MSLKCRCRWKSDHHCVFPSTLVFFLVCFVILGSIATLYAWLLFNPYARTTLSSNGCQEDNEGSWAIGVFYGDSPFSLKPIENVNFVLFPFPSRILFFYEVSGFLIFDIGAELEYNRWMYGEMRALLGLWLTLFLPVLQLPMPVSLVILLLIPFYMFR